MPIYVYKCSHCDEKIVERISNINDDDPICEECGDKMRKIISTSNFVVNGYNYKNGYSKKES